MYLDHVAVYGTKEAIPAGLVLTTRGRFFRLLALVGPVWCSATCDISIRLLIGDK